MYTELIAAGLLFLAGVPLVRKLFERKEQKTPTQGVSFDAQVYDRFKRSFLRAQEAVDRLRKAGKLPEEPEEPGQVEEKPEYPVKLQGRWGPEGVSTSTTFNVKLENSEYTTAGTSTFEYSSERERIRAYLKEKGFSVLGAANQEALEAAREYYDAVEHNKVFHTDQGNFSILAQAKNLVEILGWKPKKTGTLHVPSMTFDGTDWKPGPEVIDFEQVFKESGLTVAGKKSAVPLGLGFKHNAKCVEKGWVYRGPGNVVYFPRIDSFDKLGSRSGWDEFDAKSTRQLEDRIIGFKRLRKKLLDQRDIPVGELKLDMETYIPMAWNGTEWVPQREWDAGQEKKKRTYDIGLNGIEYVLGPARAPDQVGYYKGTWTIPYNPPGKSTKLDSISTCDQKVATFLAECWKEHPDLPWWKDVSGLPRDYLLKKGPHGPPRAEPRLAWECRQVFVDPIKVGVWVPSEPWAFYPIHSDMDWQKARVAILRMD